MEFVANIIITILSLIIVLFIIGLVHEIGHFVVARVILKETNVKITMGFFGKTVFDSKRFKINRFFFLGAYVGNYSDGEANRFHMALLFAAGAIFQVLFILPIVLYITDGIFSLGDFLNFQGLFSSYSPLRADLFSVSQLTSRGFALPWLSLVTPMDFFNMFLVHMRNINSIILCFIVFPYFYPLKLHGSSWHWNPSDGMWILKYIFNKVSEKDATNALSAINEKADGKQEKK